jgi:hypothetical protein
MKRRGWDCWGLGTVNVPGLSITVSLGYRGYVEFFLGDKTNGPKNCTSSPPYAFMASCLLTGTSDLSFSFRNIVWKQTLYSNSRKNMPVLITRVYPALERSVYEFPMPA